MAGGGGCPSAPAAWEAWVVAASRPFGSCLLILGSLKSRSFCGSEGLDGVAQGGGFYGEGVVAFGLLGMDVGSRRRGEDGELEGLASAVDEAE